MTTITLRPRRSSSASEPRYSASYSAVAAPEWMWLMARSITFTSEVNGVTWSTISLNWNNEMPSMGRRIAWAKRRADSSSSFWSPRVLRLVSMATTMESGSSDSRWNTAIFCGLSSSNTWKSSSFRVETGEPALSVTVVKTFTSLTLTLMVVPGGSSALAWAVCFCTSGGCGTVLDCGGFRLSGGCGTVLCVWASKAAQLNTTASAPTLATAPMKVLQMKGIL